MPNFTANSISIFVNSQFPSNFRTEGAMLVKFIEYYYEWLEAYENPIFVSRKLTQYRDVDYIPEKFFQFLRNEFMKSIPTNNVVDDRLLLKHIIDFYRAKGTEKAFKLLFRILYNEDVHYYYPGQDILRASDGRWVIDRSVLVSLTSDITDVAEIEGLNSGATARIDRIVKYFQSGVEVTELFLKNIFGTFLVNEQFKCRTSQSILGIIDTTLTTYPGYYQGTYGFLSWDKYLQDNFYYQEFSYELQTSNPLNTYREVVEKLAHPAGTKLFGKILILPDLNEGQYANIFVTTALSTSSGLDMNLDVETALGFSDIEVGTGGVLTYDIPLNLFTGFAFDSVNDWRFGPAGATVSNGGLTHSTPSFDYATYFAIDDEVEVRTANTIYFRKVTNAGVNDLDVFPVLPYPNATSVDFLYKESANDAILTQLTRNNEYAGTGTLEISDNSTINDLGLFTINELSGLAIEAFDGLAKIAIGTGTNFTEIKRGDVIEILNSNGSAYHVVSGIGSDQFLSIREPHIYGTVVGKTYNYNII